MSKADMKTAAILSATIMGTGAILYLMGTGKLGKQMQMLGDIITQGYGDNQ